MKKSSVVVLCLLVPAFAAPSSLKLWARREDRLVGGTDTTITEYPWQLSVIFEGSLRCGASVISSNWALTAAHCIDGLSASMLTVRAGSSYRNSGGTVLDVAQAIKNKLYYAINVDYDIAVLQPAEPFPLGSDVQPVSLPEAGYDPPSGLAVTVTGWGRIASGGSAPTVLQKVDISVIDRTTCQDIFFGVNMVTKRMVCAGEAGKSTCDGDSGGPLVSGSTQIGIVSWGNTPCQESGAVFTNVGELRSWVTNTTGV
ncbi:trypsin alpha-4-like [Schistocerca cancellata]|uniref:trypsin alpha-4-like n=1 Tax=Schistocerca cancellata TaxID=274614 RepID=UPI002117F1E7|nr:trypsin alpha-4-like [Schistocerca cancellata]